jgi:heme-degrading monooxygenase HmoA
MISRIWHGWTRRADADTYEEMLKARILPGIHRVKGFLGATVLRRDVEAETEFITITRFEDMAAVRDFAGEDYETAVIDPQADALLTHYDKKSVHYTTVGSVN